MPEFAEGSFVGALAIPAGAEWMREALCQETDPEIFFPAKGESARLALSVCAACPVRQQCLEHALKYREYDGVWGGTTSRERTYMIRAASRKTGRGAA